MENMRHAVKEQISRLKNRKVEEDFDKWNSEFLELNRCLGTKSCKKL